MGNIIVWADIPCVDVARAKDFYSHVTGYPAWFMPETDDKIALLGGPEGGGRVVSADLYEGTPSHDGSTVYLSSQGDIDGMVERVREAGGTVLQEKRFMGEMVGWIAFFEDSEGNRIGIQQPGEPS